MLWALAAAGTSWELDILNSDTPVCTVLVVLVVVRARGECGDHLVRGVRPACRALERLTLRRLVNGIQ